MQNRIAHCTILVVVEVGLDIVLEMLDSFQDGSVLEVDHVVLVAGGNRVVQNSTFVVLCWFQVHVEDEVEELAKPVLANLRYVVLSNLLGDVLEVVEYQIPAP
ncbi:hypothetical protein OGAPHI_003233 [Ogataea philodendri]|uniref:Uncharacterized protein n=1 Tax=Ogataea philodendri TaxID=1378263 RepID=A0A9P8T5W9_9ASCO|nr:uncharacterized protein OGAPHI_003233 [Ogataea philodendri]KAH3666784.1 hypothetical protein OGAPHI_003233 [Ogataea philodendri]